MDEDAPLKEEPLHVVMFDTLGVANDYSNELIEALAALPGLHLAVITVEGSPLRAHASLEVWPVLPNVAGALPLHRKALMLCKAYWRWWRVVQARPPGVVVHMQFFKLAVVEALLLLAMRKGLKALLVHTAHNALPHVRRNWHRVFYRWWYARPDLLHVLSQTVETDITQCLGVKPRRLVCIPHGPYARLYARYGQQLTRAQARARLGLPEQDFLILQFGIFRAYKGLDILLEAFAQISSVSPRRGSLRLVLAGGGAAKDFQRHQQTLAASGCADRVFWLDRHVDDEELCLCLTACDLAVFPYLHVSQSGALMLALTFGVPSVFSDLPGFREVMGVGSADTPEGSNMDVAFEAGNHSALAERLQFLIDNPAELLRLQAQQKTLLDERLNWPSIAERTAAAYRAIQVLN